MTPEVLANTDAFLIAAPNFLHHKYGKACLLADKHVLMEKPLALTEMECRELIAISQKHELTLMAKGEVHDTKQFYMGYTKETVLYDEPIDMRVMYQNEMLHFLDCIQYKSQPLTNGITALESMRIIWRLYQRQF